LKIEVGTSLLS